MSRESDHKTFFTQRGEFQGQEEGLEFWEFVLEKVKVNTGSWEERKKNYYYLNPVVTQSADFEPQEKREEVDLCLLKFENPMTNEQVKEWLENHPEYSNEWELALPEHLDALNSDQRFREMLQQRSAEVVALGASPVIEGWRRVIVFSADVFNNFRRILSYQLWDHPDGKIIWKRETSFLLVRKN